MPRTWTCEFSMNLISSFQLVQGLSGKPKKKKGILCLENWTWSSLIIPSCKCCDKEEEKVLAFPSVFFQHLKCRPEAIVLRQENWMIGITVQLQPVWDPTAAFGYLAEFLISQSRLAARRSCRFFFFFYAMDLKLVATAVILSSSYLGVTLASYPMYILDRKY